MTVPSNFVLGYRDEEIIAQAIIRDKPQALAREEKIFIQTSVSHGELSVMFVAVISL